MGAVASTPAPIRFRPMPLSDLLDELFRLYRRHFSLIVGVALLVALPGLVWTLVAGVYSNGDLAANFVGMKFYQGLTREVRIGDTTRPAILLLRDGFWTFNQSVSLRELLLKPFISDHLNEALNPSIFTRYLGVRAYVRRTVRRRSCEKWFDQYPDLSRASLEEASRALRFWHGEDYGFTGSEHFVTIANTCFEDNSAAEDE